MNGITRTVYPVAADNEEDLDIPEFRTDDESFVRTDDESYVVKIDKLDEPGSRSSGNVSVTSPSKRPQSGFGSIVIAMRIAKWMAKSYGYSNKKKSLYVSQDTVTELVVILFTAFVLLINIVYIRYFWGNTKCNLFFFLGKST